MTVTPISENAARGDNSGGLLEQLVADAVARVVPELADAVALRVAPADSEPWRVLTAVEAAERLGRSDRWVRARTKDGSLPYVLLDGGARGYLLADLQAYAAARRVGGRG